MPIPLIPDIAVVQRKLAGFPLATYQAGECMLSAGSKTGRLIRPASPPASTLIGYHRPEPFTRFKIVALQNENDIQLRGECHECYARACGVNFLRRFLR